MNPLPAVPTEHIAIANVFMHNKYVCLFCKGSEKSGCITYKNRKKTNVSCIICYFHPANIAFGDLKSKRRVRVFP